MRDRDPRLEALYEAVADAHPLDWESLRSTARDGAESELFDNLRIIATVASGPGQGQPTEERAPLPFPMWCHLRLVSRLGSGRHGETFLVWDDTLEREVCLKLFKADDGKALPPPRRSQLLEEARNLARLRAPHVVRVHGAGTDHGRVGFWMELIRGRTLAEYHLDREPVDVDEVARVGSQIAAALSAVHDAGLVHRDVKAQNVILDEDGEATLVDFGTGLPFDPDRERRPMTLRGTPLYMAPETLLGGVHSPRSDLYSLGVLLFYLLTGRFPVEAENTEKLGENHREGRVLRLTELRSDLPARLVAVIEDCLRPDPRDRPASAKEVERTLREISSSPASGRRRLLLPALLVGVLVILGGMAIGQQQRAVERVDLGRLTRLTFSGAGGIPVLSPDGEQIVYREGRLLRLMSSDGSNVRNVELPEGVRMTPWTWTPDGESILGHGSHPDHDGAVVLRVDPVSALAEVLVEGATFPAPSPDGRHLAYATTVDGYTVWIRDQLTGESRRLVELFGEGEAAYKPRWSPDGSEISYMRWRGTNHELWRVDADGRNDRQIECAPLAPRGLFAYTSDGEALVVGGEEVGVWGLWRVPTDGSVRTRLTPPSDLEELHVSRGADDDFLVYQRGLDSSWLSLLDVATGTRRRAVIMDVANRHGSFPSAREQLLYQAMIRGRWQIWSVSPSEGATPEALIQEEGVSCLQPVPDQKGGWFYLRGEKGRVWPFGKIRWRQSLWHRRADGTDAPAQHAVGDQVTWLAPGGAREGRMLYGAPAGIGTGIYVCDVEGSPRLLVPGAPEVDWTAFDWGHDMNEVLVIRVIEQDGSRHVALVALDLPSGQSRTVLLSNEFEGHQGLEGGFMVDLAMGRHAPVVALAVRYRSEPVTVIFAYDLRDGSWDEIGRVDSDGDGHLEGMGWSADGTAMVLQIHRERSDVYLWERTGQALSR